MRRLTFLVCLLCSSPVLGQPLDVSVTLRPIHSLVARLMSGIGEPQLVMRGGLSPHHYAPRPSEVRTLHHSGLVIWVGPSVEPSLAKTIRTLGDDTLTLTLSEESALELLPARLGGNWERATLNNDENDHHDAWNRDPHFWLDPVRASTAAKAIAQSLILADPENKATYLENLTNLTADLSHLDDDLKKTFEVIANKPLFVFHDAYQYLESRYSLQVLGAVTVSADRIPGAKRVSQIRALIRRAGVSCILFEPQFKPALIRVLTEKTGAHLGAIDPLGSTIEAGPKHYFVMMRQSAAVIRNCLSPSKPDKL